MLDGLLDGVDGVTDEGVDVQGPSLSLAHSLNNHPLNDKEQLKLTDKIGSWILYTEKWKKSFLKIKYLVSRTTPERSQCCSECSED